MQHIVRRLVVGGLSAGLCAVLMIGIPDLALATPPLNSCAAKSDQTVVSVYRRGELAIPLRCGTVKWGFRHIVSRGRWNETFDAKVAWTIARGQKNEAGTIYGVFDGNCRELFRVIVNPKAIYGTGFSPQGIITAFETTPPTSISWSESRSGSVPRTDCLYFDKVTARV